MSQVKISKAGRVSFTDTQKRYLLRAAALRDKLTDKAIAKKFGVNYRAVSCALLRMRAEGKS